MDNFKFNFLSQGQLGSLSIDISSFLFKTLPCYEYFLVTLFLHLLLERSAEILLIATDFVPYVVPLFIHLFEKTLSGEMLAQENSRRLARSPLEPLQNDI